MSTEPPTSASDSEGAPAALRSPLEVITDYLNQFSTGEQGGIYDRPSAEVLIRWLRDEGWQIAPIYAAGHGGAG